MSSMKSEKLEAVINELKEKGCRPDILTVAFLATGEQLIGEMYASTPGAVLEMTNPKRILRLQQVQNGGISISLMVGDLDLLESGKVQLIPQLAYRVRDQSEDSQYAILTLYKEYLDRKRITKAEEAGIVIPSQSVSPFKKG